MKMLPNPSVALVDADGRPTRPFMGVIAGMRTSDVIADSTGQATPLFTRRLQEVATKSLPSASATLFNMDGTPTRVMTALLMGLP